MEKVSNSDSEQTSQEKPSISLAGLLDTAALPNLKELFRDETIGIAAVDTSGDKLVIHSEIYGRRDRPKLEKVQEVSLAIDEAFRTRGVERIYTWSDGTDESYRYNLFMGWKPTGEEVTLDGVPSGCMEFEKVLI